MAQVCAGYLDHPPFARPVLVHNMTTMALALETSLTNTTQATLDSQQTDHTTVLAAAKTAVLALDFGSQCGAVDPVWKPVCTATEYEKTLGYGFSSELAHVHASTPDSNHSAQLSDYLWGGGALDATFAMDLPAGDYVVTAVTGVVTVVTDYSGDRLDTRFTVATTAVRDSGNLTAGMSGDRVRAGIWTTRSMTGIVGSTGQLRLNLSGRAIGSQFGGWNPAGRRQCQTENRTDCSYYSPTSWVISALLVHNKTSGAAVASLPASARASLHFHDGPGHPGAVKRC
jgi:hypothetical protein